MARLVEEEERDRDRREFIVMAEVEYKKGSTGGGAIQDVNVINEVNIRDLSCDRDHPDICDRANRILGIISTITDPVNISDNCARLLGQICVSGAPIDPRAIRALTFLTDKVDVSGSSVTASISGTPDVNVTDKCNRQLGTLCSGGAPIDPRDRNWNLNKATDSVDVSGSSVTTESGSVATMDDAFMELRLMADALKDIPLTIDPNTSRVRIKLEESGIVLNVIVNSGTITTVTTVNTVNTVNTVTTVQTVNSVTDIAKLGGRSAELFQDDIIEKVFLEAVRMQVI